MEIIRFNVWDLRADRREAVQAWVRSLGIDNLDDFAAFAAIVPGEKEWELHLSRYVRNEAGGIRLDVARDDVVTEPVVFPIGHGKSWPDLGPEAEAKPVMVHFKAPDADAAKAIRDAVEKAVKTTRGRF